MRAIRCGPSPPIAAISNMCATRPSSPWPLPNGGSPMSVVRFCGPDTDAFVSSVRRHADEFTARTGLDLKVRIVPSDDYFSNDIRHFMDADEAADVYMSGPVLLWEHLAAGYVEPLDAFVAGASAAFDLNDFFAPLISSNRWSGKFGDSLGSGHLWEIPVNYEAYNLAYVPATLERLGCEIPGTWAEYFAAADLVQRKSNGALHGFGQRGVQIWHTMYTGYATQFWAYGASDFDKQGKCAIASPQGIAATTAFIEGLRKSGPAAWLDQRWFELAMDFAADKYGFIVDSDHYTAFYEDGSKSSINGRVGYALPPVGPAGQHTSNMWTWSLVLNARSRHKSDAWRFVEWASGKPFLLRAAFEGNMNPVRKSSWEDERFRDASKGWGDFYAVARQLVEHDARVLITPTPHYLRLADRWVAGLRSAFAGHEGVAEALERAAQ
ncbi:MAG: extracellular solute-binding protein, partial [Cucumibacter sp.]